eukprot:359811-Chlamydomonas_euryale.AAC.2
MDGWSVLLKNPRQLGCMTRPCARHGPGLSNYPLCNDCDLAAVDVVVIASGKASVTVTVTAWILLRRVWPLSLPVLHYSRAMQWDNRVKLDGFDAWMRAWMGSMGGCVYGWAQRVDVCIDGLKMCMRAWGAHKLSSSAITTCTECPFPHSTHLCVDFMAHSHILERVQSTRYQFGWIQHIY